MCEIIRFAWGTSSLGDFVLAMSDKGVVALEFSLLRAVMEGALRVRFPEAELKSAQAEQAGLVKVVTGVIDDPTTDCDVPLDLRGTPQEVRVWMMLRAIPAGRTTTYGALAARLGSSNPKAVAETIASNPIAVIVPCHRVIRSNGSISGYRWGVKRKRALLEREQRLREH